MQAAGHWNTTGHGAITQKIGPFKGLILVGQWERCKWKEKGNSFFIFMQVVDIKLKTLTLLKHRFLGLGLRVYSVRLGGSQEWTLLTSSQVTVMLLIYGIHFESHWYRVLGYSESLGMSMALGFAPGLPSPCSITPGHTLPLAYRFLSSSVASSCAVPLEHWAPAILASVQVLG